MEHKEITRKPFRGELALAVAVVINSFSVVLMLYSGAGISTISGVPYAFSEVLTFFSLGTWTYLFQAALVLTLMILRRRFVLPYLLSFAVGFVFSELLDVHELWIDVLPAQLGWRVVYFVVSYLLISLGIALSNHCRLPIIPTDLFPRELSQITGLSYPKIKISFDAICLVVTAGMTYLFLGQVKGIGIGTVLSALTIGKVIGVIGNWLDRHFVFEVHRRRPSGTRGRTDFHKALKTGARGSGFFLCLTPFGPGSCESDFSGAFRRRRGACAISSKAAGNCRAYTTNKHKKTCEISRMSARKQFLKSSLTL